MTRKARSARIFRFSETKYDFGALGLHITLTPELQLCLVLAAAFMPFSESRVFSLSVHVTPSKTVNPCCSRDNGSPSGGASDRVSSLGLRRSLQYRQL